MLDLPPDADDEAMVELAIALSLQEQAGAQVLSLQGLPLPGAQVLGLSVEAGVSSDTASGMKKEVVSLSTWMQCILKSKNRISHVCESKIKCGAVLY